jgi:pyridoxine 5-phosphate synthase
MAHKINADKIEIHTGRFAQAEKVSDVEQELKNISQIISMSNKLGLGINAGHGLNYHNIIPLVKLGGIEEFNIGHSIISRALFVGLKEAVFEMKKLITSSEKA